MGGNPVLVRSGLPFPRGLEHSSYLSAHCVPRGLLRSPVRLGEWDRSGAGCRDHGPILGAGALDLGPAVYIPTPKAAGAEWAGRPCWGWYLGRFIICDLLGHHDSRSVGSLRARSAAGWKLKKQSADSLAPLLYCDYISVSAYMRGYKSVSGCEAILA